MDLKSLELKIPPPVVFVVFGGILWLTARTAPWASASLAGKTFIASAFAAAAGGIAITSILALLRAGTTVKPEDPHRATRLIVTGVYSMTRNPMYLALLLLLIAWAVYLENMAAAVPIPLFVAYLERFQIGPEERALRSLFGSEYEEYCKHVRRWL